MSREYRSYWPIIPHDEQEWRTKYANFARTVIEIGAGQGLHAIQYAETHPETLLIALERTQTKFARMQSRLTHHPHIQNLYILNQDAIPWISSHLSSEEIDDIYILYPNPYPKASQANKRWHRMPFMDYLIDTLKPSGTLTLATNIQSYYHDAHQCFLNHEKITVTHSGHIAADHKGRTHFERKYLERGETCYEILLTKR